MGFLTKFFLFAGIASALWITWLWHKEVPIPELKDEWWGEGKAVAVDETVKPFKIRVPDDVLADLKDRLNRSNRLVEPLEGVEFQYGFNSKTLQKVKDYWMNTYDWRKQETFLNSFPQFKTNINGLNIHFVHSKPNKNLVGKKKILPLLMLHGWPGSFVEFTKIIPLLVEGSKDDDFVFEVVAPSLPGYGFSDSARKPGMGPAEMGLIFDRLMKRLGYKQYYVQGGDWGSLIGSTMATLFPHRVTGLHLNMLAVNTPASNIGLALGSLWPTLLVPADKVHLFYPLGPIFGNILLETGYLHLQATKPDTIGAALSDTPIGLAAYILEKFSTWTNKENKAKPDGGLLEKFTMDELLNDVMIYWVTNSITTSVRLYSEAFSAKQLGYKLDSIVCLVPTGAAVFVEELYLQPEPLVKLKFQNLVSYNIMDRGGHFAAYEEPLLMAQDVRQFVNKVEKLNKGQ